MTAKLLRSSIIITAIGLASVALAAGIDGLQYQREMTAKLKNGKMLNISVGEMGGQTMAIIPMEDLNDLYERAEGHSMSTYN
jgi:hypothetical protein